MRRHPEEIVRADPEAALWVDRVGFLAAHVPELALPSYSHLELGDVLAPLVVGVVDLRQDGVTVPHTAHSGSRRIANFLNCMVRRS